MNIKLITLTLLVMLAMVSCQKSSNPAPTVATVNGTGQIKVPVNFNWQNSRNINFTVNVTDARFGSALFVVSIYDGYPTTGNLMAKGSASTTVPFISKIYLSSQVTQAYIVKTAPDGTKIIQVAPVANNDVVTSIGL